MAEHHKIAGANVALSVKDLPLDGFVPTPHHIVVEPLPPEQYVGMFFIPETLRKKQAIGTVRSIAPSDDDGPYEVGDLVLYADGAGTDVVFSGKEHKILQYHTSEEGDILGRWPHEVFDAARLESA